MKRRSGAVLKWERGLCILDIALLKPQVEALSITVMEHISRAREKHETHPETMDSVVKVVL